jgi:hypothetical protein
VYRQTKRRPERAPLFHEFWQISWMRDHISRQVGTPINEVAIRRLDLVSLEALQPDVHHFRFGACLYTPSRTIPSTYLQITPLIVTGESAKISPAHSGNRNWRCRDRSIHRQFTKGLLSVRLSDAVRMPDLEFVFVNAKGSRRSFLRKGGRLHRHAAVDSRILIFNCHHPRCPTFQPLV